MTLHPNSTLQGGKYRIIKVLGQGGFGITYLAEQTMLERKVAIKEFFMKEFCERDESTSHVTMGTAGARETVERFREKFLKEARNIAKLKHPHIIQILDVFEENGTAYYVMEYAENGSLLTLVADNKPLPEAQATRYILQVADALAYIHERRMNHLDIKPGNIMLNEKDEAVLIDFGLSKQYDDVGQQTSTTPVGMSEGYAPMEQYKQGGVKEFSPETDIYALGATFFKLLTGVTPPGASDVNEDGLPVDELKKKGVSQAAMDVITKAMEPRKKQRLHDVKDIIEMLSAGQIGQQPDYEQNPSEKITKEDEETVLIEPKAKDATKEKEVTGSNNVENKSNEYIPSLSPQPVSEPQPQPSPSVQRKLFIIACVVAFIGIGLYFVFSGDNSQKQSEITDVSINVFKQSQIEASVKNQLDSIASLATYIKGIPGIQDMQERQMLTQKEKNVKPAYLIDPAKTVELQTLSKQYRALAMLFVDKKVAEAYDMDITPYDNAISKLLAEVNDPALGVLNSSVTFEENISSLYYAEEAAGRINLFWEMTTASTIEQMYILCHNIDIDITAIDDEAAENMTFRMIVLTDAMDRLAEYDANIADFDDVMEPLKLLDALTADQLKAQLMELKGDIEMVRASLLK